MVVIIVEMGEKDSGSGDGGCGGSVSGGCCGGYSSLVVEGAVAYLVTRGRRMLKI